MRFDATSSTNFQMSNKHKTPRILAIDPGTREMGTAVLHGQELVHHGVKEFRDRGTPHDNLREGRRAVLRLINEYKPSILALEKSFFANNRNAALLNVLVDEIQAVGRRKGLKVVTYAPSTVKKTVCGNGRATKRQVAKAVVREYRELRVFVPQDKKWKEQYHANMFDAVAVGLTAMRQMPM